MDQPKVHSAALLRFVVSSAGQEKVLTVQKQEAFIGRSSPEQPMDIDLAADINVSRRHARVWLENGGHWVEDLNSRGGTLLNGVEIKGQGKRAVPPTGATLETGNTKIRIEIPKDPVLSYLLLPTTKPVELTIDQELSATALAKDLVPPDSIAALQNMLKLLDFSQQLFRSGSHHELLPMILEKALELIPAEAGAVLLHNRNHDTLHLAAHTGEPTWPEPLARRTMTLNHGLSWHSGPPGEFGLFAPLRWNEKTSGVICLSRRYTAAFSPQDLPTLIVLARFAACALEKAGG